MNAEMLPPHLILVGGMRIPLTSAARTYRYICIYLWVLSREVHAIYISFTDGAAQNAEITDTIASNEKSRISVKDVV